MSFLDKLSKGVGKAAEQAKFEADRLMRQSRVGSEAAEVSRQMAELNATVVARVLELRQAGAIQDERLIGLLAQVEDLRGQLQAKSAELDAIRTERPAEQGSAPQPGVPAANLPASGEKLPAEAASLKFCPDCGASLEPGVKFCPSCGHAIQ